MSPDSPEALARLVTAELRRWRFRLDNEAALQSQVFDRLVAAGFVAAREVRLGPADRIDVLVGEPAGPAFVVEVAVDQVERTS